MRKGKIYSENDLEAMKQKIISTCEKGKTETQLKQSLLYLEIAKSALNDKHVAHAKYMIARSMHVSGNHHKAIKYFNLSLNIYEKLGLKRNIESALISLAACNNLLMNFDESIEYYERALEIHSSDVINKASIYNNIACIHMNSSDQNAALVYFDTALELLDKDLVAHQSLFYQVVKNKAKNFLLKGDITEAERLFMEVKEFGKQSDLKQLQANSKLGLAQCAMKQYNTQKAEKWINKSIKISEKAGLKPLYLIGRIELAKLYLESNQLSKLESLLVDCYSVALSFHPQSLNDILTLMAKYYKIIDRPDLVAIFKDEITHSKPSSLKRIKSLLA